MIDTAKIEAVFRAAPLCRNTWVRRDDDNRAAPTYLCAASALLVAAGMSAELIEQLIAADDGEGLVVPGAFDAKGPIVPVTMIAWYVNVALPVLKVAYGIPASIAAVIPRTFDFARNEAEGICRVLDMCEDYNDTLPAHERDPRAREGNATPTLADVVCA